MIEAKNICKKFDEVDAIKDLSCKINEGCIYGIVGSNGAGKSTFLRLLTGVYKPDSGSITLDGEDIFDNPNAKSRMVFISDELYFIKGASLNRMKKLYECMYETFDKKVFSELVKKFSLPEKKSIETFSKGMRRQASIVLALSVKPDYYIFDETFDGLDPVVRGYVKSLICKEVAERKATAIITSHSIRELDNLCDELAFVYNGSIIIENTTDDLKNTLFKIQGVFEKDISEKDFEDSEILKISKVGSVYTLICCGDKEIFKQRIKNMKPVFYDLLPLTLEEIFVYRMMMQGYTYENIMED